MHETMEDAEQETLRMLDIYADFCEKSLAIPVLKGRKTNKEKFAGAVATYTIEAMMHDGKALQSGTSHYFGDGFSRAFDVKFQGRDNTQQYPHQTSWGMSTRIIGAIIMTHGDDSGLVLPPDIAPIQLVIIPVAQHKEGVLEAAEALKARLSQNWRVKLDATDNSAGWKYAEYEVKGVPLRLEIGPKDIEAGQCVLVRRDTRQKYFVPLTELEQKIPEILAEYRQALYEKAAANRQNRTFTAAALEDMRTCCEQQSGYVKAMWCGEEACELKLKEDCGVTSRCIPFEQEQIASTCICCGKPAKSMVVWGKAY